NGVCAYRRFWLQVRPDPGGPWGCRVRNRGLDSSLRTRREPPRRHLVTPPAARPAQPNENPCRPWASHRNRGTLGPATCPVKVSQPALASLVFSSVHPQVYDDLSWLSSWLVRRLLQRTRLRPENQARSGRGRLAQLRAVLFFRS